MSRTYSKAYLLLKEGKRGDDNLFLTHVAISCWHKSVVVRLLGLAINYNGACVCVFGGLFSSVSPTPGSVISALHTKPTASRLNTPRLYVTKSHRMESKDFGDTLNRAMTAHVPIVAAHTSEVDATIAEVLKFGLTTVPEMRVKGPEGDLFESP